ncbi:hypothetical protein [Bacillus arachidis]|uniref:Uncharacterized protein n=1 Tax=Bacillus arachidis TaxID=2819290 RepID=A0ABS3P5I2_9BACI|nr:hypothetical protein [Bacillus arachidis]MBO1628295.1 hypothetical protein [Bacillus arachidis]
MDNLNTMVEKLLNEIDEDFRSIEKYNKKQSEVLDKQEKKIKETATTLLPIMRKIKSNMYFFTAKENNLIARTRRGPILKFDNIEDLLYVFSVDSEMPMIVDLNNEDNVKYISYDKLLREVEFTQIMENLLSVLTFTDSIKKQYQNTINQFETELTKYENL